jgi:hypothetical protein
MIHGFLFGVGFSIAIFIVPVIAIVIIKLIKGPKRAPLSVWKDYFEKIKGEERFAEARFISNLIDQNKNAVEVKTPDGYKVTTSSRLTLDDGLGIKEIYHIEKTKDMLNDNA